MGRGRYTMGKIVDIPWVGGVNIPWIGGQNTMDMGVDIPWLGGSKCHG